MADIYFQRQYLILLDEEQAGADGIREFEERHPLAVIASIHASGLVTVPGTDEKKNCITIHVWEKEKEVICFR